MVMFYIGYRAGAVFGWGVLMHSFWEGALSQKKKFSEKFFPFFDVGGKVLSNFQSNPIQKVHEVL